MKIGIQLPEVERVVRWPEYIAVARAAEEVGFDSIWVGDHLLYDDVERGSERGPWEAWTLLGALAAATSRVRLGPLVACAGFHPPAVLAKMAATLSEISAGRFVLGLGAGWNRREFDAFGLPYDRRVARFEEAFAIIRGLLANERVTLQGQFHRADDAVLLPAPEWRTPLLVGSNGPRMLAATLPHVDVWNTWYRDFGNTPDGFERLNAQITEAALAAGREPGAVERSACALVQLDGPVERRAEVPAITGAPDAVAARLRELGEAGADEVIVVASPITEASVRALGAALAR